MRTGGRTRNMVPSGYGGFRKGGEWFCIIVEFHSLLLLEGLDRGKDGTFTQLFEASWQLLKFPDVRVGARICQSVVLETLV